MAIKDLITQTTQNLPKAEKPKKASEIKAKEIKKLVSVPKKARTKLDVEIVAVTDYQTPLGNWGVEVLAKAWDKNGKQYGFGKDGSVEIERFRIINPPVLVPDGTTKTITLNDGTEATVDNFKEDTQEALLQVIEDSIFNKKQKFTDSNITIGKIGSTTLNAFAYNDGEVNKNDATTTWAAVRDGTAGSEVFETLNNTITLDNTPGVREDGGSDYDMFRAFFIFDTSSIGSDTVDSGTVSIYNSAASDGDNDAQGYLALTDFTPDNVADVVLADYNNFADTLFSDTEDLSTITTSDYVVYTLTTAGKSDVDGSGYTSYMLREGHDIEDTPIGNGLNNRGQTNFSDQTGTTKDPKISIEHSGAAAAATPTLMMLGIGT